MDDQTPTAVIKIIQKLKSETGSQRMSSSSMMNTSSVSSIGALNESGMDDFLSPKRQRLNSGSFSYDQQAPPSPWEWRRLKGEVVSLKSRISQQEAHIQQMHNTRRQIEEMMESEIKMLKSHNDRDKQTIKQLEARLDVNKRTINDLKEQKSELEKELYQTKWKLEKEIALLKETAIGHHQPEIFKTDEESNDEEMKEILEKENDELKDQVIAMEERIKQLQDKTVELLESQKDFELQNVELQNAKAKIEKLEFERSLWEEGKHLANRAAMATNLERELVAAKDIINSLRDSVKGKLLLEEQIMSMKKRLEHTDILEQKVATLEASQIELVMKLKEYESIGMSGDPLELKRELNRLQQSELVHMTEESQLRSKMESYQKECTNLSKKYEEAKKLAAEMASSSEKSNKLVSRLQKKMILVSRERDSYRQQLDAYEKEISTDNTSSIMADKVAALESMIQGYRDLTAKLEAELDAADNGNLKEECSKLKSEVQRLQLEIEYRALKGDFNCDAKILHYRMNPAAIAEKAAEERHLAMQEELEDLRAKVASGAVGDVGVSALQVQEMEELKQSHELKIARLKEVFKASSSEFRQACYQLFGWRIDRAKEGMYKLSSQYAESPDDFLCFQMNNDEDLLLLETTFSATLNDLIEKHLHIQKSIPMFLSAVQTDLFSQQTMTTMMT